MRLRRVALWTMAAAAALVACVVAILLSFDIDAYRDEVAAAVTEATGRPVGVEGKLSLAIGLRPRLVAEGVTLGNPAGFSRPDMLRVRRLEAEARLWPLLQGAVEIDRLVLEGVDLLLERGPDGQGNWSFAGEQERAEAPPHIRELAVRDAALAWRMGDSVGFLQIDKLTAAEKAGVIDAELTGRVQERPVRLGGRFTADLGQPAPKVVVRDLSFAFGEIAGEGELSVVAAGGRPRLEGRLVVAALDLDRAFGPGKAASDGRLIPELALDPAPLDAVDADLAFSIGRLVAAERVFEEATGRLRLEAGQLTATELSAGFARGRLTGALQARPRNRGVAVGVQAELAKVEFADLAGGGPVSGRIDAKADLKGEGASLRALASSLGGEVRLVGRDGRIAGYALDLAAADMLRLLAPWTERGGDTRITCMLFASTVRQGVANVDALAIDSDRVLVTGAGKIDLRRERLDLELTPRPKEPSLVSLATPVDVRGPLADPSVSPDEAGLARKAAGALLGNLVLPGAGFLLPFLSAGAEDHPCAATLASKPAATEPAKEEGVRGFFRDLGRTIDRTLGTGR